MEICLSWIARLSSSRAKGGTFSWGREPGPGTPSWTPGQVKAILLHT